MGRQTSTPPERLDEVGEGERHKREGGKGSLAQAGGLPQRRGGQRVRAGEGLDVVDDGAVLLRHALDLDDGGGAGAGVDEALSRPGAVAGGVGGVVNGAVDLPMIHGGATHGRQLQRRPQVGRPVGRAAHVVLHGVGLAGSGVGGQRGRDGALRAVGGRRGRVQVDAQLAAGRVRGRAVRYCEQDLHPCAARRPVDDGGAGRVRIDCGVARHVAGLKVAVGERDHAALGLRGGRGRGPWRRGGGVERVDEVVVVKFPPGLGFHQIGVEVWAAAGQAHAAQRPH